MAVLPSVTPMQAIKSAVVIAAAAAFALGGLAALPSAGAAPACQAWKLDGDTLSMTTSDGSKATFHWDPGSQRPVSGTMISGGSYWFDDFISGKIEGETVSFTAAWVEKNVTFDGTPIPSKIYTDFFKATINPDGRAAGTRLDSANNSTSWTSDQLFTCAKRAEEPKPQGPQSQQDPQPQTPAEPQKPPPVTNAIKLSFGPAKLGSITATISNSSNLPAQCTYDATPDFDSHREFAVPPNGSTPLTFRGFNTGTTYHAVVTCNDSSGTQSEPLGRVETDFRF